MTLTEFIARVPNGLRIGQRFVNKYWKHSDSNSQLLYQLDGLKAIIYIQNVMEAWQWEEMPDEDTE